MASRMRVAARVTEGPDEWATRMMRSLQIPSPSKNTAASLLALSHQVREARAENAWLELLDRENGLLMAMCRKISEERAATKEEVDHV
jgi:hypothetical protein